MKQKICIIASILSLILGLTSKGVCQWVQTNGPYGGTVTCFEKKGSILFAGTQGSGVFRSMDNGKSWKVISNGLSSLKVSTLLVKGEDLFVGTFDGTDPNGQWMSSVFHSTDSGTTWQPAWSGLYSSYINCCASCGSQFYAGSSDNGVFIPSNNGV